MDNIVKVLEIVNALLAELGNVTLEEAKTWAEVEANAGDLRREGHEEN